MNVSREQQNSIPLAPQVFKYASENHTRTCVFTAIRQLDEVL